MLPGKIGSSSTSTTPCRAGRPRTSPPRRRPRSTTRRPPCRRRRRSSRAAACSTSPAAFRLFGNFGLGVGYNPISKDGVGTITAKVPAPALLRPAAHGDGRDRRAEAQGRRRSTSWASSSCRITNKFDVTVSAGPTFFTLEQDTHRERRRSTASGAPYTTITLNSVTKVTTKKSKVGFNVGADATVRADDERRHRRRSSVTPSANGRDHARRPATRREVNVGGLQFGGGLRLRF